MDPMLDILPGQVAQETAVDKPPGPPTPSPQDSPSSSGPLNPSLNRQARPPSSSPTSQLETGPQPGASQCINTDNTLELAALPPGEHDEDKHEEEHHLVAEHTPNVDAQAEPAVQEAPGPSIGDLGKFNSDKRSVLKWTAVAMVCTLLWSGVISGATMGPLVGIVPYLNDAAVTSTDAAATQHDALLLLGSTGLLFYYLACAVAHSTRRKASKACAAGC